MAASAENVTATYTVNLETKGVSETAKGRAELEALRKSITGSSGNLKEMQAQLRLLKGGGDQTRESQNKLKAAIAAQRSQLAGASQAYLTAGGKVADLSKKQTTWTEALKQASPKLGGLVEKVQKIPVGMLAMAAGAAVATAAIVALTAATAAGAASLVGYAIKQADARRSELLRLEGLTKLRNFWAGFSAPTANGKATAIALQTAIDDVSGSVALGRDQVAGYASDLYKMGLRGENLRLTLQGMATTSAVLGEEQARTFAGWAAGANLTGQSVKRLADDVKARLGGIAKAQTLSLSNQLAKLKENFAGLFRDLKIERLLEAISGVTRLFSASSAAGKAMRELLTSAIQPLINIFAGNGDTMRDFFLGAATGALEFTNVILDALIWGKKLAKEFGLFGDKTKGAFETGRTAAKLLGGGLLALAAITGGVLLGGLVALTVAVGSFAISMLAAAAPVLAVGAALAGLAFLGYQAYKFFQEVDWSLLGKSIIDGIVGGLTAGVTAIVGAVKGLASAAWKAWQTATDSHSPSRLFKRGGKDLAAGGTEGIKEGAPQVAAASAQMGQQAASSFSGSTAPQGAAVARNSSSITIGAITIQVGSESTAKDIASEVRREIEKALEGIAIQEAA